MTLKDLTYEEAKLRDVPGSAVREQLQDVKGRTHRGYDAEYGTRDDDGALVFHFFPAGYSAGLTKDWPNWHAFRDQLETALMGTFDVSAIDAGYVPELRSFFAILPYPVTLDVRPTIQRFFSLLEAGLDTE